VAGAGARRGVLVICGGYTAEATAFAKGKPLDLVDGEALLEMLLEVRR
jgi:restriction system protein